ncbi:MarC family protein [Limimaricola sp.]|uniref:MarC family protein n=1 Tax=Limimaricola sp. TaxID=2211665 RepID=UPI0040583C40
MIELATLVTAFTTLFVIVDPIGLAPLFVAMTAGMSDSQRRKIAARALLTSAGLMLLFLLLGDAVLRFIGISVPAFRIAGGVLLFLTALDMLFERRQARRRDNAEEASDAVEAEPDHDPSIFPLALPLIVGPGAITTLILLTAEADAVGYAAIYGVALVVLATVWIASLLANPLARVLGSVGLNVVTRVLGMLLAALAVQFIIDGLHGSGFGLPFPGAE